MSRRITVSAPFRPGSRDVATAVSPCAARCARAASAALTATATTPLCPAAMRYLDNVGAWMSVEPAIDFTAGVPFALSRVIAGDR